MHKHLDLRQEPVIVKASDSNGLYYMVEICDMWTNAFAYIGGKATGYKGGTFALVGPGWKGELPAGVTRIDSPTPWVLIQPRVHVYVGGKLNLPLAKKVLDAIQPVGLAEFSGKPALPAPKYDYPAPVFADPNLPVSALDFRIHYSSGNCVVDSHHPPQTARKPNKTGHFCASVCET